MVVGCNSNLAKCLLIFLKFSLVCYLTEMKLLLLVVIFYYFMLHMILVIQLFLSLFLRPVSCAQSAGHWAQNNNGIRMLLNAAVCLKYLPYFSIWYNEWKYDLQQATVLREDLPGFIFESNRGTKHSFTAETTMGAEFVAGWSGQRNKKFRSKVEETRQKVIYRMGCSVSSRFNYSFYEELSAV